MKNILIINNDFDTMSLLKGWLGKKGYKVKFTGNHDEAIKLIKEFNPSLIIIDILQAPLVCDIKSHNEFDVPMLLMTGYTSKPVAKKLPVADSIEKPFDLQLFERKIKNLLKDNV